MLIPRRMSLPEKSSFFLFGPRATGKSTWLKHQVKADHVINLLKSQDFLKYSRQPELLSQMVKAHPEWKCLVIDEIQKVPQLLDEVHSLIFDLDEEVQFILTGSSARKLKRSENNLLAGRALVRNFHPLVGVELKSRLDMEQVLSFGLLPKVWRLDTESEKKDYLSAYVTTYLREEIQQEAVVRNVPAYASFLEHIALRNGHVLNMQNLAQEVGVARTTLQSYLQILEDTLLGRTLQPIHMKAKVKEVSTPKFYLFDTGVVRALARSLDEPLAEDRGVLLETWVLHELVSYSDAEQKRWEFFYWGTPSENEVDFIVSSGKSHVGIEVKASTRWKSDFEKGLRVLLKAGKIKKAYVVYMGEELLNIDGITVIPAHQFSAFLAKGKLF